MAEIRFDGDFLVHNLLMLYLWVRDPFFWKNQEGLCKPEAESRSLLWIALTPRHNLPSTQSRVSRGHRKPCRVGKNVPAHSAARRNLSRLVQSLRSWRGYAALPIRSLASNGVCLSNLLTVSTWQLLLGKWICGALMTRSWLIGRSMYIPRGARAFLQLTYQWLQCLVVHVSWMEKLESWSAVKAIILHILFWRDVCPIPGIIWGWTNSLHTCID